LSQLLLYLFTCIWTALTESRQEQLELHHPWDNCSIMVRFYSSWLPYCTRILFVRVACVGCDAFAVHLVLLTLLTSLQLRHDAKAVISVLYVFIPWWLAHWEEYHTGVMVYGSGLWGVTEANYAVVLVHLYTYLIGPAGWTTKPLSGLGSKCHSMGNFEFPCNLLSSMMINDILLLTFGLMGASLFFQQVARVFKLSGSETLLKTTLPQEERGFKQLGYGAALSHLLQILWTCLGCGMVLMLPLVPPVHSRVVFEIFGINYALQATRMIMAHMSKEPFQIAVWPNLLIGFQILNHYLGFFDPIFVAYFVLVAIGCGYLFYISSIISEICDFLGISALTITQSKKE